MTGTEQSCVSNDRLEQLIGSGTPNSREIHDMAVELLISRRAALTASASEPAPPCECMFPRDCNGSCELPRQATHTDDAHPIVVLADVLRCAEVWEPEVRIIGNVRAGDIVRAIRSWPTTASTSPVPASEPEPVAWIANCCQCGRIVDTREIDQGGDKFGCELTDGRWTCSNECYDTATGYLEDAKPTPTPDAVDTAIKDVPFADLIGSPEEAKLRRYVRAVLKHHSVLDGVLTSDLVSMMLALSHPADGWRDIESAPKDETLFLAACPPDANFPDGRVMIWKGSILAFQNDKTPDHLRFPATHWRPLPAAPLAAKPEGE